MKNLIIILLLLISTNSCIVAKTATYKIMYLESDTVAYTHNIPKTIKEDMDVYKLHNGQWIKIISYYE